MTDSLRERLLGPHPSENALGELADVDLPVLFAMARIDKIKNLSALVEMYGQNESLREHANLLIVSSVIDAADSEDQEEIDEVHKMHGLIEQYGLQQSFRWCASRLDKVETGEIYRIVAERGGLFAQPALMETFGLTVVEAMACGLPVVVTCFGGPAEIVIDGSSGFVRDPNDHKAFSQGMDDVVSDRDLWNQFSSAGIKRVDEAFTWSRHAERMLRLANVYTYWNHLDVMNRQALDRYVHTLYHTVFRPRAAALLESTKPAD